MVEGYRVSARRACGLVQCHWATYYYRGHPRDVRAIRQRLRALAAARPASAIGACTSCSAGRAGASMPRRRTGSTARRRSGCGCGVAGSGPASFVWCRWPRPGRMSGGAWTSWWIRILLECIQAELSVVELCRRQKLDGGGQGPHAWDTLRDASTAEAQHLKGENERLKRLVAELSLQNRAADPEARGSASSNRELLRNPWVPLAGRVTV